MNLDILKEKVEKMCGKCRYITPADVAILMECAWETERDEKSKKEIENSVRKFGKCFDERMDVCEKAGRLCIFAETGSLSGGEEEALTEAICASAEKSGYQSPEIFILKNRKRESVKLTAARRVCSGGGNTAEKEIPAENWPRAVSDFITEKFALCGVGLCVPYILGVGIGNTAGEAKRLAMYAALARNAGSPSTNAEGCVIEKKLLRRLNRPKSGYACIGGHNSVLSLNVEVTEDEVQTPVCVLFPACFAIGRQKTEL